MKHIVSSILQTACPPNGMFMGMLDLISGKPIVLLYKIVVNVILCHFCIRLWKCSSHCHCSDEARILCWRKEPKKMCFTGFSAGIFWCRKRMWFVASPEFHVKVTQSKNVDAETHSVSDSNWIGS